MKAKIMGLWVLILLLAATGLQAQYFGRNKANYETFDFKVYQSPHFEIYNYLDNPERLKEYTEEAERWYEMHQRVLADTIKGRNPIILYNNHADFQQTNAISGSIGVGTGGVTEALKNRVVLPLAMSHQQSHHVLGHELVHAFQYNMILNGDSTSLQSLGNLPLWMVEGLAEYMSIGSVDAHTAMWMRDAVLRDDVPTLRDLQNPKYFPYRYGQVFWAFLTGLKGDDIIEPFFVATAKYGFEMACMRELSMSEKNLSELWVQALKAHFGQFIGKDVKEDRQVGKQLLGKQNAGEINIAPEISPNGRYVIFLSEKDLFSIDLFLADARTGEIIRKVASSRKAGHIDDFNYIESSGTWSPDSKEFAFVAVSKGRNILVVKEALTGKTVKELPIDGVQAFSNPTWSPDGKTIAVVGLVDGQVDIYAVNIRSGKVEQLTDDIYSEMHPRWSEDGSYMVFSSDQLSRERGRANGRWYFNLARLDLSSGAVTNYEVFPGADNLNPVIDTAGNLIFLSNRDGFRNLYQYEPYSGKVYQLTDLITGVSGITHYAPAISIAQRRDRVLYTYFSQNGYSIYRASPSDFMYKEVNPDSVDFTAATLPRVNRRAIDLVDRQLRELPPRADIADTSLTTIPYKPKFKLDYVGGSAGVGVGTSNTFGTQTGLAGGVDLFFGDILGNNQLFTSLALNGEITDFGGAVAYINRDKRLNWGGSLSHIPFRSFGFGGTGFEEIPISDNANALVVADTFFVQRIFEDKLSAFAFYPFSTTLRIEGSASFSRYSSRLDRYVNFYQTDGTFIGNLIGQEREKVDGGFKGFNLFNTGAAFVGDNAVFGLVGPLDGQRFRLGMDKYFGEFNFWFATADYRRYHFFKPFGLAFRALHYGRYGQGSDDLFPMFVGSSWYVRGYNTGNVGNFLSENGRNVDELFGSKMIVSNVEVRLPFSGPERLALIKSGVFFSELALFLDGGLAWYNSDQFRGDVLLLDGEGNPVKGPTGEPRVIYYEAKPVFSTGVSLRVNLFGAMVLEPYYAFPIMTENNVKLGDGTFGLNIIPAW
ncbi:MAG: PD40 domain-containing protein [Lewinellaceae bacterium]|nr:PD40 domain-containing protein [Lewinellaceae bacterium]